MTDLLAAFYPWIKSIHIMAVISWMAGLFYLPRLFVHHAETAGQEGHTHETFCMMEGKPQKIVLSRIGKFFVFSLARFSIQNNQQLTLDDVLHYIIDWSNVVLPYVPKFTKEDLNCTYR